MNGEQMRLLLVLALVSCTAIVAQQIVSGPTIKVSFPQELADLYPNGIDERPAMFGIPSYASSVTGRLIWATVNGRDSCSTFNNTGWPLGPKILVVDRGVCSFVQKVRLAQERGAVAAIVVDNIDEAGLPYMADDGTGSTIAIPSALIHKNDGINLKRYLQGDESMIPGTGYVTATLSWSLPRPDNRVEYDLWSSAVDETSRSWKNNWERAAEALQEHAKFTPRQWIVDGTDFGCTIPPYRCGNQCIMNGKYCAVDPDGDFNVGASGGDIVRENLRQMCLYDYLNRTNYYDVQQYWEYQKCFQSKCYPVSASASKSNVTATCSLACMSGIKVPWKAIDQCIQDAGGDASSSSAINTRLKAEIELRRALGMFYLPTMLVNLTPYRGSLSCPTPIDSATCGPLNMICEGFQEGTRPAACASSPGCWVGELKDGCGVCGGDNSTCADCAGVAYGVATIDQSGDCCTQSQRDVCGKCGGSATSCGISVGTIVGISIACVAVAGAGVFCYMRRQNNRLKNDIDSLLKQYLPLDAANSLAHPNRAGQDGTNLIPESEQTTPSDL